MTNVSYKPLDKDTDEKIKQLFTDFLGSLSSEQAADFYQSFFTKSEQIMFVKRLAIIMMLERGAAYSHIAKVLEVSPSTVDATDKRKENGDYDAFIKAFSTDERKSRFWRALRILIDENLHRYTSSGWRWIDRLDEELNT